MDSPMAAAEQQHQSQRRSVLQDWVTQLPLMQQTVLLTAIRGPDNTPKYTPAKMMVRWLRRCVLLSAMDQRVLQTPYEKGGGSFTGPSIDPDAIRVSMDGTETPRWEARMEWVFNEYLRMLDELPSHFASHFRHASEILGYKHPDERIRKWWHSIYCSLVNDMHLHPESMADMDARLSDNREEWLKRNNAATID